MHTIAKTIRSVAGFAIGLFYFIYYYYYFFLIFWNGNLIYIENYQK